MRWACRWRRARAPRSWNERGPRCVESHRRPRGPGRILTGSSPWVSRPETGCSPFGSRCTARRPPRGWGCCWSGRFSAWRPPWDSLEGQRGGDRRGTGEEAGSPALRALEGSMGPRGRHGGAGGRAVLAVWHGGGPRGHPGGPGAAAEAGLGAVRPRPPGRSDGPATTGRCGWLQHDGQLGGRDLRARPSSAWRAEPVGRGPAQGLRARGARQWCPSQQPGAQLGPCRPRSSKTHGARAGGPSGRGHWVPAPPQGQPHGAPGRRAARLSLTTWAQPPGPLTRHRHCTPPAPCHLPLSGPRAPHDVLGAKCPTPSCPHCPQVTPHAVTETQRGTGRPSAPGGGSASGGPSLTARPPGCGRGSQTPPAGGGSWPAARGGLEAAPSPPWGCRRPGLRAFADPLRLGGPRAVRWGGCASSLTLDGSTGAPRGNRPARVTRT